MTETRVMRYRRLGAGVATLLFPVLLLAGFLLHPDLLSLERVTTAGELVDEFRGNAAFHVGHLLVLGAAPLIVATMVHLVSAARGRGAWLVTVGGMAAVAGAMVLAVDKGALTLTLSAFDTLTDGELVGLAPGLQALLDRDGWLWLLWLLALLPVGAAVVAVGLHRDGLVPGWQAVAMAAGALLLLSPDIEIISVAGAAVLAVGYVPLGVRILRQPLASALAVESVRLPSRPLVVRIPRSRPRSVIR